MKTPTAQDTFLSIPGPISCTEVIGGSLSEPHTSVVYGNT